TGLVRTNRTDRSGVEVFRLNIFSDEVWVKATVFLIRVDQRITEFTCNRSQEGIVGVSFNQRRISHLADIATQSLQVALTDRVIRRLRDIALGKGEARKGHDGDTCNRQRCRQNLWPPLRGNLRLFNAVVLAVVMPQRLNDANGDDDKTNDHDHGGGFNGHELHGTVPPWNAEGRYVPPGIPAS